MGYGLIETTSKRVLTEQVQRCLDSGWSLQGGVSTYCTAGNSIYYVQAIVKGE